MKKKILLLALASLAASCDFIDDIIGKEDDNTEQTTEDGIQFTTSIGNLTKASATQFDAGDKITVTAYDSEGYIVTNAAEYTYNNSLLSSDDPITYSEQGASYTFYGAYPAVSSLESTFEFYAKDDQSSASNLAQSDLLFASVTSSELTPVLSFTHKMSSIIINIKGDDSGSLNIYAKTGVLYNGSTNSSETLGNNTTVKPYLSDTDSHRAILSPQSIVSGSTFATYAIGDTQYEWILDSNFEMKAGILYEFTWQLAENTVSLNSEIEDWEIVNGGTIY